MARLDDEALRRVVGMVCFRGTFSWAALKGSRGRTTIFEAALLLKQALVVLVLRCVCACLHRA